MLQAQTAPPMPPAPPAPVEPGLFQTPPPPMPDFLFWNEIVVPLVGMVLTGIIVIVVGLPLVKALVRRIEGKSTGALAGEAEVAALRGEVAELRQRLETLTELEERLDFAERMLAQNRQPPRLREGA